MPIRKVRNLRKLTSSRISEFPFLYQSLIIQKRELTIRAVPTNHISCFPESRINFVFH